MKFFHYSVIVLLLVSSSVVKAQDSPHTRSIEFGIKGGGTFTHGYTTIPGQNVGAVQVPTFDNKNNGIGIGYSGGLWARKNFSKFFIQAEVTYNRFVLKQKTNVTLDVNANTSLANALPVSVQPGLLTATLNVVSEPVLESINVPVLIGKRWMDGKLRSYAGPTLIVVQQAKAKRTTSGVLNANPNVSFPETPIPATTGTTNLLNKYEAQNLEVKDVTFGLEVGAGYSLLKFLDVDVRYALPVGGVYKDSTIKGFLGIGTVTLNYKIF
ncbi:outer membrane beta-barrel protein [Spirosoma sp. BT702]|uniref:Outer membrane beta-barrel protein n=1 Tax=Spirosoma profusum TaxID=2771354 RepID=A0A927AS30_9BACT|nr:outer membrane beta-barrel protein [Spirosoma profusum]MBD2700620.1 outer membrane beta-barrel protein [Spirosoma profusum]